MNLEAMQFLVKYSDGTYAQITAKQFFRKEGRKYKIYKMLQKETTINERS